MIRSLSRMLALAAVGLIVWGGHAALSPSGVGAEPPLYVEDATRDCGALALGVHTLEFRITNPSGRDRAIIGLAAACRESCCFRSRVPDRVHVPPGGTVSYPCELSVHRPGPFEAPMTLFVEENGIREITLTVKGLGVAPGKYDGDKAAPR